MILNNFYEISDEPYSPADSDPDTSAPTVPPTKVNSFLDTGLPTQILEPFTNKFDTIPGNWMATQANRL